LSKRTVLWCWDDDSPLLLLLEEEVEEEVPWAFAFGSETK